MFTLHVVVCLLSNSRDAISHSAHVIIVYPIHTITWSGSPANFKGSKAPVTLHTITIRYQKIVRLFLIGELFFWFRYRIVIVCSVTGGLNNRTTIHVEGDLKVHKSFVIILLLIFFNRFLLFIQ